MTISKRRSASSTSAKGEVPLQPGLQIVREALGLVMLFLGAFVLLTLLSHNPEDPSFNHASDTAAVHNLAGRTGALLSDGLYQAFGYGSYWLVLFLIVPGYRLLRSNPEDVIYLDRVMAAPVFAAVSMTLHALFTSATPGPDAFPPAGPGGVLGSALAETMRHAFGFWGGLLLILPLGVLSLMVLMRVSVTGLIEQIHDLGEIKLPRPNSVPEAKQMVAQSSVNLFSKALELSGKLIVACVGIIAALPLLMHALMERLRASTPTKSRPQPVSSPLKPGNDLLPETRVEPVIELSPAPIPAPEPVGQAVQTASVTASAACDAFPPSALLPEPPLSPSSVAKTTSPSSLELLSGRSLARKLAEETGASALAPVVGMASNRQDGRSSPAEGVSAEPTVTIDKPSVSFSLTSSAGPAVTLDKPTFALSIGTAGKSSATESPAETPFADDSQSAFQRRQGVVFIKKSPESSVDASSDNISGVPRTPSDLESPSFAIPAAPAAGQAARMPQEPVELDPDEERVSDEGIPPLAPWSGRPVGDVADDEDGDFVEERLARMPQMALSTAESELELYQSPDLESDEPLDEEEEVFEPSLEDTRAPLPPLSILALPEDTGYHGPSRDELQSTARLLEQKLEDFKVKGQIIDAHPGPVITTYELDPAPGLRSAKVVGLADDLARSISAVSVRVVGNIPGKNVIGIEIPNANRRTVYLREILDSETFRQVRSPLAMALGSDINGRPVVGNLAKMPHLLVAGTTGSGKSVAVNAMICSVLFTCRPEDVRFLMVDPKMLELSIYEGIPHLLAPVVTDVNKAAALLKWAVAEMEERYRLMSELGVRNLSGYNQRIQECLISGEEPTRRVKVGFDPETGRPVEQEEPIPLEKKPLIVIIIDELADLMIQVGKDVEPAIARLAQMARAAGLHLIIATQRPSVDVITGLIKANFPTRLAFQVSSKIDSRTILDSMGADRLLGMGDGLFQPPGTGQLQRIHAPFVSDSEVHKLVKFLKSTGRPEYDLSILAHGGADDVDEGGFGDGVADEYDPLYDQAVAVVVRARKVSTSMVQRHFKIGYNRAARIVERMAMDGLISEPNHSGKREVLTPNQDGGR
ncbi:MAG: DNA translocase FtsK 4TM domain-containing protein [Magnetococcus sp. YQC-9]